MFLALARQLHEWFFYYKMKRVDLMRIWLGPIPIISTYSADAVKVIAFKFSFYLNLRFY
jgi:hypothetical protein